MLSAGWVVSAPCPVPSASWVVTALLHSLPLLAGVPVSSRVSAKIQQLVNTLKRPKRPPLREFFVDDFEELLEGECPPAPTP